MALPLLREHYDVVAIIAATLDLQRVFIALTQIPVGFNLLFYESFDGIANDPYFRRLARDRITKRGELTC